MRPISNVLDTIVAATLYTITLYFDSRQTIGATHLLTLKCTWLFMILDYLNVNSRLNKSLIRVLTAFFVCDYHSEKSDGNHSKMEFKIIEPYSKRTHIFIAQSVLSTK